MTSKKFQNEQIKADNLIKMGFFEDQFHFISFFNYCFNSLLAPCLCFLNI